MERKSVIYTYCEACVDTKYYDDMRCAKIIQNNHNITVEELTEKHPFYDSLNYHGCHVLQDCVNCKSYSAVIYLLNTFDFKKEGIKKLFGENKGWYIIEIALNTKDLLIIQTLIDYFELTRDILFTAGMSEPIPDNVLIR
jgi:hypothetical protein